MEINDSLPTFDLKGTDGHQHTSAEFSDQKLLVVIFTCNHCPYARAYIRRINDIVQKYAPLKVAIVAINPNDASKYPQDSYDNMIPMAKSLGLPALYLHDEDQKIAQDFGAKRTPEVFVFDEDRKLKYMGAIDDNWEHPNQVSESYLERVLDALLDMQTVPVSTTQAVGCTIKWK